MKSTFFLHILIMVFVCKNPLMAQLSFFDTNDSTINQYHYNLYAYNFNKSLAALKHLDDKVNINNKYLFQVNYIWWEIIAGDQNQEEFTKCFEILENAEMNIAKQNPCNEKEEITALLIYLFEARIHVFNSHYYKALVGYSKLLNMLKKLNQDMEGKISEEKKLVLALYHFSIGKIKEKYPMFYPYFLLLPKADFDLGKKWLAECIKSKNIVISTEAMYFLMKISLEIDKNYETANVFANKLVNLYPQNILFLFYQYQVYFSLNDKTNAERIFNDIKTQSLNLDFLSQNQKDHFIKIIEKDYNLNELK